MPICVVGGHPFLAHRHGNEKYCYEHRIAKQRKIVMAEDRRTQSEVAAILTELLVKPSVYTGHGSISPLQQYVQATIMDMCRKHVVEVIAEYPELTDTIRKRIEESVRQALRTDDYLNWLAVAKQLTDISLERGKD